MAAAHRTALKPALCAARNADSRLEVLAEAREKQQNKLIKKSEQQLFRFFDQLIISTLV